MTRHERLVGRLHCALAHATYALVRFEDARVFDDEQRIAEAWDKYTEAIRRLSAAIERLNELPVPKYRSHRRPNCAGRRKVPPAGG
jgi:hypothetical protein